jgi:hypothetical protein
VSTFTPEAALFDTTKRNLHRARNAIIDLDDAVLETGLWSRRRRPVRTVCRWQARLVQHRGPSSVAPPVMISAPFCTASARCAWTFASAGHKRISDQLFDHHRELAGECGGDTALHVNAIGDCKSLACAGPTRADQGVGLSGQFSRGAPQCCE